MTDDVERIAKGLVRAMATACDRTQAHRKQDAVIVPTASWHRLMSLADEARQYLERNS